MSRHECSSSELSDADLERVAGGKELRDALTRTAANADATLATWRQTARDVSGSADKLAKSFDVK